MNKTLKLVKESIEAKADKIIICRSCYKKSYGKDGLEELEALLIQNGYSRPNRTIKGNGSCRAEYVKLRKPLKS